MPTCEITTMSRKIDQTLDALEKHSSLSHDGRSWLIAACDPFHDTDITLAGYPDVNTSSTIVQLVKKQLQIAQPIGLGANWDASIVLFPTMASINLPFSATVSPLGEITGTTTLPNPFNVGGLTVNTAISGSNLWPSSAGPVSAVPSFTSVSLDCAEFIKGDVRIIGMGFEVVNTTSALNKQGQVTVYRMPTVPTLTKLDYLVATVGPANTTGYASTAAYSHRFPPSNINFAQLLYGSRSWAAEEGNYTVSRQNSEENKLQAPDWIQDIYTADATPTDPTEVYLASQPGFAGFAGKPADIHAPYDISGAHYTGLSSQTTLTINVRWLLERSPGPNEPDLVVLATPSSAYDPLALELYTHCMQRMPPAVKLAENPLGEWFRSALSTVAKWAPKIGNFVGNVLPGASAMGTAIGSGAQAAANLFPQKKQKEENVKQPLEGSASTTGAKDLPTAMVKTTQKRRRIVYKKK